MGNSKYDNDFKSLVIENGYYKDFIKKKKQLYYNDKILVLDEELGVFNEKHGTLWSDYVFAHLKDPYFDCSMRLNESRYRRVSRASKRIEAIMSDNNSVFVTLTFRDDVLENTSKETRRRYVARYLKENCIDYVANIDYGVDDRFTHREHYHAVIGSRVDLNKWTFGFAYAETIRLHDGCEKRMARYVIKLTAHAFKTNTQDRLIYSRN